MSGQHADDTMNDSNEAKSTFLKSLFAKKYSSNEKYPAAFKTGKLWVALLGELFGTMFLTLALMCLLGVFRPNWVPLLIFFAILSTFIVFAKVSGANLNPIVTAGTMLTRRMPIIRGLLYILAQFLGAGFAALILQMFKNAGGASMVAIPTELIAVDETNFFAIALIELLGAIILSFCFIRALKNSKNNTLIFAFCVSSSIVFMHLIGLLLSQNYYSLYSSLIFNPASAAFYGIFSSITGGIGQLALIILAYIVVPIVGGIIGAYIADSASILSQESGSKLHEETQL